MSQKQEAAIKVRGFICAWMRSTTPGLISVRVTRDRRVMTKDPLGWRDVGPLDGWVQVATALGAISKGQS